MSDVLLLKRTDDNLEHRGLCRVMAAWRGDLDWAAFESACRTVAPHRPMPLRWIGTASGRPGNQRSSAWISGLPGFRAVLSDARWRTAAWGTVLLLLPGCPVVQSVDGCPCASLGVGGASGQRWPRPLAGGWRLACLNPGTRGNARTRG